MGKNREDKIAELQALSELPGAESVYRTALASLRKTYKPRVSKKPTKRRKRTARK